MSTLPHRLRPGANTSPLKATAWKQKPIESGSGVNDALRWEDLDGRLDGYDWGSEWEHDLSPQAKAAILLREQKLDCALTEHGQKVGRMDFVDWGGHPGSCERWVDLRDDLTASLLQARLVELEHPIRIVLGRPNGQPLA